MEAFWWEGYIHCLMMLGYAVFSSVISASYSYTFIDIIMLYHNLLPSALSLSPSGDNSTLSLTLIALSNPFVEVGLYPSLIVLACVLSKKSLLDIPLKGIITSGTITNGELLHGNTAAACCCWHPVNTKTFMAGVHSNAWKKSYSSLKCEFLFLWLDFCIKPELILILKVDFHANSIFGQKLCRFLFNF